MATKLLKSKLATLGHDALKRMVTGGVEVCDNNVTVRISKLTKEIVGKDMIVQVVAQGVHDLGVPRPA